MKHLTTFITSATLFVFPVLVSAQTLTLTNSNLTGGLREILNFVNAVLIPFIIGIAFLFFVWGIIQYFVIGASSEDNRKNGRNLMIYATLGFVIIIVFWGLINLLVGGLGLQGKSLDPSLVPNTGTTVPGGKL
jgi:hypothetical protein